MANTWKIARGKGSPQLSIAIVAVLLIAVALAACYAPIRKAMTIDPVKVLYRE